MRRVQVGEQEADRDRLRAAGHDLLGGPGRLGVGQGRDGLAPIVEPLRDREAKLRAGERFRLVQVQVVHMRPHLPADLQQVAEALGRDGGDLRAAPLDQRIGRDRGAVGEARHGVERRIMRVRKRLQAGENRLAGVRRRRRAFENDLAARRVLAGVEIREGAANVDTDGPGHGRVRPACDGRKRRSPAGRR